jgi:hypothetical protein
VSKIGFFDFLKCEECEKTKNNIPELLTGDYYVEVIFKDGSKLSSLPFYNKLKLNNLSRKVALSKKEDIEYFIVEEMIESYGDEITINYKDTRMVYISKNKGE